MATSVTNLLIVMLAIHDLRQSEARFAQTLNPLSAGFPLALAPHLHSMTEASLAQLFSGDQGHVRSLNSILDLADADGLNEDCGGLPSDFLSVRS